MPVLTAGFSSSCSPDGLEATPIRCGVLGGRFLQSNAMRQEKHNVAYTNYSGFGNSDRPG